MKPNITFVVEKNVALPARTRRGGSKYPFASMEVGDSFAVPVARSSAVLAAATKYGKDNGVKFSTRTLGDTFRVWRVEEVG